MHTHYQPTKIKRRYRVRRRLLAAGTRPRLHVFRSHQHFYAQIIDDVQGKTLVSIGDSDLPKTTATKTEKASKLGESIGKKAKTKKLSKVRFDRGPYRYHGRVRAFAEAARAAGLEF